MISRAAISPLAGAASPTASGERQESRSAGSVVAPEPAHGGTDAFNASERERIQRVFSRTT